ncbi:pyridine nucleotide-disulfide oxidoreductase [Microlunatus endophyticus]|nr:pyridine nucleotide-disulfide oxidoreductase [Microlunatus endophyticus]
MMRDLYGLRLTTGEQAGRAYNEAIAAVLRLHPGAIGGASRAIALDPTFALGHAAVALLGYEFGERVDISARLAAARRHAVGATERERSHVHAVERHVGGDSGPLLRHLEQWPADSLLLSVAVPTIAFTGAPILPGQAWDLVESCRPAYGDDWWFTGLLAFMRQEQHRFDEAMDLACRSLDAEPAGGHAAHARAHAHYETGDHVSGLAWMDDWITHDGRTVERLAHFSWHAAMHELSLGDLDAVARRYDDQLQPTPALGCRALVDSGSLLWRWSITPGADGVPPIDDVLAIAPDVVAAPPTAFMAMHVAVAHCAAGDTAALVSLESWCARSDNRCIREVCTPLTQALRRLASGDPGKAADDLAAIESQLWRVGGSEAQREIVEETRIAALLRAGRYLEARDVLDTRLDRRHSPRDRRWRDEAASSLPASSAPRIRKLRL